ncbi:hypothetical protein [Alkalihalobacillus pseudalcaliphilus]|uniref:hypothetical protein n=1 Tax=Alkalihalobacillus pseudalcaliphilus TaxID=79884 RepID=UPI00064DF3B8|nr:hypothetical protein [Alkalihalobacillus pseudalcaliphilus]KMK75879.1 hypothetical protein AB990_11500 [Alkalihalobacillus pseudalcaliphilus]
MFHRRNVLFILFLFLIAAATVIYATTYYPPLVATPSLSEQINGKNVQLISVGNKSKIGDIKFLEILVNESDVPEDVRIQHSNVKEGFVHTDKFEPSDNHPLFIEIKDSAIPKNTDPYLQLMNINSGDVTEQDVDTYALHIVHDGRIHDVVIKYQYLATKMEKRLRIF